MRARDKELGAFAEKGLLAGFGPEEIEAVLAAARRLECPAGKTIMREGDAGETMYLLADGEVEVSKNLTLKLGLHDFARAEKSMTRISAAIAPVFGEMALFASEPRSATVTAATTCVLYEIDRAAFWALGERNPRLALELVRRIAAILSSRVRKGNEEILKLSTALSIALSR
ncbi:MAG: cyclic nucleotide-binding domain-containing protein [Spirochaetaceae bacterium]|nr:cyclic nucleotide-binding domain-containing protein [Spirochaetaceae bacterium]